MNTALERPAVVARNQVRPISLTTAMSREGLGVGRTQVERAWPKVVASIGAMRGLREDWDGDGAKVPPSGVIDTAHELVKDLRNVGLPCPTTTGAGPNGTVLLAWERGGRYFEIDIVAPGDAEWFRSEPGSPAAGGVTIPRAILALVEWVQV